MLPGVGATRALTILRAQLHQNPGSLVQETHTLLAQALQLLGSIAADADVFAVRRALCVPAALGVRLFPGASQLLRTLRTMSLRCVIISNVDARVALEYERDFVDFGIAHLIDAIVTSLDVGFRKPHLAMFQAAIREAGCVRHGWKLGVERCPARCATWCARHTRCDRGTSPGIECCGRGRN